MSKFDPSPPESSATFVSGRQRLRWAAGETAWGVLARAKGFVIRSSAAGLSGALRWAPRLSAATRDRLQIIRRLDYPDATVWLTIDGERELLTRVHACAKEPETVRWIRTRVLPGDVLFDIGANVGAYALVAHAATAGRAQVIAFEPSFSTFAQLCRNVLANGAGRHITPLNAALGQRTGLAAMMFSSIEAGAALHVLSPEPSVRAAGQELIVPVFALDDLVRLLSLPQPHHIKLDVDGGELDVLRGATSVLAGPALKTVLIEMIEGDVQSEQAHRLLVHSGFTLTERHVHGAGGAGAPVNCIFVRP